MVKSIELRDVSIKVKRRPLLQNVNFKIKSGEIVQIIGENGAGKSTLLEVITGLRTVNSGSVLIDNKKLERGQFLQSVGAVINTPRFIGNMTGIENLLLLANINKKISKTQVQKWMRKCQYFCGSFKTISLSLIS